MTITHKGHPLFLWTNSRLTLGCPAGLSSSLMCSPRRSCRQLHHARLGQSSPAPRLVFSRWRSSSAAPLTRRFSTASRPATHPPRRLCRCRQGAPASSVLPATSQLPRRPDQQLPDAAALSSMQGLPWSGNSSAQTSASLHPPAALRLRVLPFTRTWSSTVCAEEFPTPLEKVYLPDCICPLDCCCSDRRKSVGPSAPIAYATSVSPPDEAVAWPGTHILDAG